MAARSRQTNCGRIPSSSRATAWSGRSPRKAVGAFPPLRSTLALDPTTSPKQMDDTLSTPVGTTRRIGIYKLDGDQLTLCYNNTGKQRPGEFESKPGSSLALTILRRQKAK